MRDSRIQHVLRRQCRTRQDGPLTELLPPEPGRVDDDMPVGGGEVLLRGTGQQCRIRHRIEPIVVDHARVVDREPVTAATEEESPSRDDHTGTASKCAHRRGSFQNVRVTRRTYRRTGGCVKKSSRLYSATALETTSGS